MDGTSPHQPYNVLYNVQLYHQASTPNVAWPREFPHWLCRLGDGFRNVTRHLVLLRLNSCLACLIPKIAMDLGKRH